MSDVHDGPESVGNLRRMRLRPQLLGLFFLLSSATGAQRPPATPTPEPPGKADAFSEIATVVTKHTVGGLAYTATAGQIPLRNDAGEVECRMFYVAYTKEGGSLDRPVTFAFNGGPGSATIWLHMGALAPRRAPMNDDGSLPKPPFRVVDNAESWLDFTDVVLIDAPNTGYSRIAKPELGTKFFGVQQDIAAFTDFIRNWLKEHRRWSSPLFIAGESYGGIRGSGLCASLFRAGIAVNGFISISGVSNLMTIDGMRGNDATYIGFLPTLSACAWYHKKLSPKFKSVESLTEEVRAWIDREYAAALQRGDSLSPAEKDRIAARLAEYTGLSKKYILASNLRLSEGRFFRELLRDDSLTIGRLDGRLVGKEELGVGDRGSGDPSDEAITAPYVSAFNDYVDRELGVKTQMRYMTYGNVGNWQEPQGSYAETSSDLRYVLARNPHFRVLYACGYYDLACPFNGSIYTVNHMGLDAESRSRVSFAYYPAGHMMYIEKGSRKKFHDDAAAFVAQCLGK